MATPPFNKIVLKNTTKMSLNERFTAYRAEAQTSANSYRQRIQMQRQASSANLRLAQQMANRPTVIAALRLKKRSLQQRLGRKQPSSNIKMRLNLNARRINNINNNLRGRLGTIRGRRGNRRGRGNFKSGTSPLLKARLGTPKSGFNSNSNQRFGNRNRRGGNRGGNRSGNRMQNQRSPAGRNNRGRGRGGRGGFGRGRWNNSKVEAQPTKQELDNQLDEYMAETKSSLDAQLGQYMSQG